MKIEKNTAVTLSFKVSDALGKLIEESKDPMVYLHGGYGNTLPKIEAALEGQEAGFQTTLALAAEDAFGLRDESLVQTIPRTQFPAGVKVGGQLEGRWPRAGVLRLKNQRSDRHPRRQPSAGGQGAALYAESDRRAGRV